MTSVEKVAFKRKLQLETSRQPSANGSPRGSIANSPTRVESYSPDRVQPRRTAREFTRKASVFNTGSVPTSNRRSSLDIGPTQPTAQNEVSELKQSMSKMRYETIKQIENMRNEHSNELKRIRNENKELKRLIQAGFNNLSSQNSDSTSTANIANNTEDSAQWSDDDLEEMSLSTHQKDL